MTRLVGITGKARAGKDTAAQVLVSEGWKRSAFADPLKVATAFIANEPSHLYFDDETKEQHTDALNMTRRSALQKVGKAVRDSLGPDTWVNRALRDWQDSGCPDTVISDVRYDNEAQLILDQGGIVIRVVRPDNVGLPGEAGKHESEAGVAEELVSVEVINDGTIGDLAHEIRKAVLAFYPESHD